MHDNMQVKGPFGLCCLLLYKVTCNYKWCNCPLLVTWTKALPTYIIHKYTKPTKSKKRTHEMTQDIDAVSIITVCIRLLCTGDILVLVCYASNHTRECLTDAPAWCVYNRLACCCYRCHVSLVPLLISMLAGRLTSPLWLESNPDSMPSACYPNPAATLYAHGYTSISLMWRPLLVPSSLLCFHRCCECHYCPPVKALYQLAHSCHSW